MPGFILSERVLGLAGDFPKTGESPKYQECPTFDVVAAKELFETRQVIMYYKIIYILLGAVSFCVAVSITH